MQAPRLALALFTSLALTACSQTGIPGAERGSAPAPSTAAQGDDEGLPETKPIVYICDGGAMVAAIYEDDEAVVTYEGRSEQMETVRSASGARYAGEEWIWWTKGNTGFLQTRADETTIVDGCSLHGEE
ncbi:MliC family protein [Fodinicurvata halophila]|uniref:MliC family protein n=1 Tax=Fodinicurvata halophila TaxID=1419723 RepID=A0ABV8UN31_9PROT